MSEELSRKSPERAIYVGYVNLTTWNIWGCINLAKLNYCKIQLHNWPFHSVWSYERNAVYENEVWISVALKLFIKPPNGYIDINTGVGFYEIVLSVQRDWLWSRCVHKYLISWVSGCSGSNSITYANCNITYGATVNMKATISQCSSSR